VSYRYIEWLHAGAGSQNGADHFIFVHQTTPGAALICHRFVFTYETALGDTDGWNLGQHTEMAGNAKAPRVGPPLAVTEQKIGHPAQSAQRIQYRRNFSKGEQARNVGKFRLPPGYRLLVQFQGGESQNSDGGPGHGAFLFKADIDAGNETYSIPMIRGRDLAAQFLLNTARLRRRYVPGMSMSNLQFGQDPTIAACNYDHWASKTTTTERGDFKK
jgi:hypothetical protein